MFITISSNDSQSLVIPPPTEMTVLLGNLCWVKSHFSDPSCKSNHKYFDNKKKGQNQFVLLLPPPLEDSSCSPSTYSLPWLSCHSPSVVDVFLMIRHIKTRQNVWITDIWCVGSLTTMLSSIPVWFVSVSSWWKLENITTLPRSLCPCNIFKKLSCLVPLSSTSTLLWREDPFHVVWICSL